jgi:integrase/recombinase XerD
MSLSDIIANYIEQQRCLGKRFSAEATILAAFRSAVSDAPLRDIRPDMISRFVVRDGTSDETRRKKYRVVSGLFRFAVRRQLLKASPVPQPPRMRCYSSYTPYIYSEAELKRLLAVVPTATASPRCVIGADTLRTLLLLLYGAGLRRGEALRLKLGDVDVAQSLIHIRGTKFFKTRIVPLSTEPATRIDSCIGAVHRRAQSPTCRVVCPGSNGADEEGRQHQPDVPREVGSGCFARCS